MRYCSNCGALNDTDANFCSRCGKPLKPIAENANINNNQNKVYTTKADNNMYQPVYNYTQGTTEAVNPVPVEGAAVPQVAAQTTVKGKVLGIIGFVFGIESTALSFIGIIPLFGQIFGFIHLAMAIVGLIFCGKSEFRLARPGKILCIIGIVLTAIFLILGFIVLAEGAYDYYDYYYYY